MIEDNVSGMTMKRPGWLKLMKKVDAGKVTDIYMDELSRMGRSKEEGFLAWMSLYDKGVALHFIKQPQVDTQTFKVAASRSISINTEHLPSAEKELISCIVKAINRYMQELAKLQVYRVFDEAQFERDILSQRTSEGLKIARINGAQIGRKQGSYISTKKETSSKKKIKKLYKKYGGPLSATDCMRVCKISRDSFYRYIKQMDG
ncbi:resolvase family protein (plasmid) [Butyrivibrio proteoclasticus B316]|uniref:Resolvase family protein n=1 Tax=Butyrivibrio proteoclasticus (strain ATCC 51982 / DSM 14932 / B316) TaxID=515622 RepID=E0S409_BUTPB|nr:resolvase family protein [Butyrivibrio proteoclasticus B316]